jgi:hypothetical protein
MPYTFNSEGSSSVSKKWPGETGNNITQVPLFIFFLLLTSYTDWP